MKCLGRALDIYNTLYDKVCLVGDFNTEENESVINTFLDLYHLRNKVVRANDMPYMTKTPRKAIATTSKLENQFHNKRNEVRKKAYRKQKKLLHLIIQEGKEKLLFAFRS